MLKAAFWRVRKLRDTMKARAPAPRPALQRQSAAALLEDLNADLAVECVLAKMLW